MATKPSRYRLRLPTYGPSKAALETLSAIMAKDLDGTGVTVNVLVPGGAANTHDLCLQRALRQSGETAPIRAPRWKRFAPAARLRSRDRSLRWRSALRRGLARPRSRDPSTQSPRNIRRRAGCIAPRTRAELEIGAVLVDRADAFFAAHPNSEDQLRRVFTLRLATVREGEEPTRRRAPRSEFTDEEWRLVTELADHPNRLLVTATSEVGETYAEVAHEAVFRRWDKLREWIAAERKFLAWRTGLEAARRGWQATPDSSKSEALLMGVALTQAQSWLAQRPQDLSASDQDFIEQGAQRARRARTRAWYLQALVYVLLVGIILGLIVVINEAYIKEQVNWYWTMRPYRVANFDQHVLDPEAERVKKPGDTFRECAKDCPEMVVVPAGEFMMGSLVNEQGRYNNEADGNGHPHKVTIAQKFAVSKFDVTFADWDACVSVGGCPHASDTGWGRNTRPVINVSWDDAQTYVAWFSRMTGKTYRLLTEAEWEYAARADTQTAYFWGNDVGKDNANCQGCGSQWDGLQTSPVRSFKPNAFGLYDMAGNVWQWVQDCHHDNYNGSPTDGSSWTTGDCNIRVVRGGAWNSSPQLLRSASRGRETANSRADFLGFRVGRTLSAGAGAITVAPGAPYVQGRP